MQVIFGIHLRPTLLVQKLLLNEVGAVKWEAIFLELSEILGACDIVFNKEADEPSLDRLGIRLGQQAITSRTVLPTVLVVTEKNRIG